ncbi:DNA repair ATPase [Streptacidiphilus jiangxiensis]|uniref:DNA repair ATPase n=3 Tax=Streptacidiphilus jiangxiensis TaxID=235985 RepID=A0A1H7EZK7_STRJI|nr:DNA repair ATPase [Streptacidiphilus jiangxiensis]SEK19279.1 DNA repair ATPase [Streptacidiphilus jiangxiensis]
MGVEDGTYQILRARLAERATELGRRAAEVNSARQEAFGSRALELAASARPRTAGEGRACGVVAVRPDVLLVGTSAPDLDAGLLSLHGLDGSALDPGTVPGLLDDERFHRDLAELLRYYRDARLVDLVRTATGRLLAVFRTGENDGDQRVLSWQLGDGQVEYLGNHGERDLPQPPVYALPWTTVGREHHDHGRIRIEGGGGAVAVATTGGSLTVRTVPGDRVLFEEPVDEPLQSLADATVAYAETGPLLLLRIRPYNEPADRHLVVNVRTGSVRRQDSLALGARLLPAEQGLIFPGGYELADGTHRAFHVDGGDTAATATGEGQDALRFDAVVPAPNGEDLLYVLRRPGRAQVLLLPWNTVRREAGAALHGAAYTLLPDGTLVLLKPDREPVRTHELQRWDTPFQSADHAAAQPVGDGPLARIGNADLVRGIADCLDVVRTAAVAAQDSEAASRAPELILDACARAVDRHYWLADTGLLRPLEELRDAAEQLAAEQARVRGLAARAAQALEQAREEAASLVRRSHGEPPVDADGWTRLLAELRQSQGRTRLLRELPQLDVAALDRIEADLAAELTAATERAFAFFASPDAFAAPLATARRAAEEAEAVAGSTEAGQLADRLAEQADALATVTDLVTGAVAADPAAGTAVLLAIGEVLAAVNRARAVLANRRRALLDAEHRAAHAAESALLAQATTAALTAADSPASCDDQLARLMLRVDALEARFAEAEDLAADLALRREEIQQAFATRRQTLLDEAAARADRVAASARRALEALRRRLAGLGSAADIHAAEAADPMAVRVRAAAGELRGLDDQVRAQELEDGLTGAVRTALRDLRDRADLSGDGGASVRLGRHRFAVRREPVELTLQPDGDGLAFLVTGTGYRRPARLPELLGGREFWTQPLVSESPTLYRAEYLAAALLRDARALTGPDVGPDVTAVPLLDQVRRAAERAYDEGYERGVHDHDAALILDALLRLRAGAGLLEYPAQVRAAAQLFWAHGATDAQRAAWQRRARSLVLARAQFGAAGTVGALTELGAELAAAVAAFTDPLGLPGAARAGDYLVAELADPRDGFATGLAARALLDGFRHTDAAAALTADLRALDADLPARHQLATAWLAAYAASRADGGGSGSGAGAAGAVAAPAAASGAARTTGVGDAAASGATFDVTRTTGAGHAAAAADAFGASRGHGVGDAALSGDALGAARGHGVERSPAGGSGSGGWAAGVDGLAEAVAALVAPALTRYEITAAVSETVTGLLGAHPRVQDGRLVVRIDELPHRARVFREERAPAFRAFQRQRADVLAAERTRLRLDDYRPRPLAGFVRNQLIDQVYLPLVGDNLAKQLGTLDATATTDRSGLLLLLSPPGYGKTTLLEYVADRLGLLMVRVDGPALGHGTTSLDPDRAPDAAARREVEKIVFALEAGSNVLLHVDDIQHVSAELLQKFIPLCDTQRRVEAVSDGVARSFDLRGRRFAVCLAGNPYTANGQRFEIPDMLANRADVWNLGEVLTGHQGLFALSFLENALAANPVLAPLAGSDPADLRLLVALADGDPAAQADQLGRPVPDLDRAVATLARLRRVQETVLAVNGAYIASAAQEESSRTEPPFLLQGSYRTMAQLAARIDPVQSDAEVQALLDDHYLAEARTLGSAAEANLLKLAQLRGRATAEQSARWKVLCSGYGPGGSGVSNGYGSDGWAAGHPSSLAPNTAVSRV